MNVLITSGGTEEAIDHVRKITNMGTGRLGSQIAEAFSARPEVKRIFYLCAPGAVIPERKETGAELVLIRIHGVEELQEQLELLLIQEQIDAVVHSMAVSDYSVRGMTTVEILASSLTDRMAEAPKAFLKPLERAVQGSAEGRAELKCWVKSVIEERACAIESSGKVSSSLDDLMLSMGRTPKLIGRIKEQSPDTILVGFKLLDGVPEEELRSVAEALMKKNRCDFVLANDLQQVGSREHRALLIRPDGSFDRMGTKQEIAERIAVRVLETYGAQKRGGRDE